VKQHARRDSGELHRAFLVAALHDHVRERHALRAGGVEHQVTRALDAYGSSSSRTNATLGNAWHPVPLRPRTLSTARSPSSDTHWALEAAAQPSATSSDFAGTRLKHTGSPYFLLSASMPPSDLPVAPDV
jgi:hypothetical protein